MTAHWGVPDPAAVQGTDMQKTEAFRDAFRALERRITIFASLPIKTLDRMRLQAKLDEIGQTPADNV